MNKEQHKEIAKRHHRAYLYFVSIGQIPYDTEETYVLHHKDPTLKCTDRARYEEWRPDDLIPMTSHDHLVLHNQLKETIERRRAKMIGRKHSDEARARMSESQRKRYAEHGAPKRTEAWCRHISEANKGHAVSEETRRKLSEHSDHHVPKSAWKKGNVPWNKGKKMPEEFCKKMSELNRGRVQTSEEIEKRTLSVRKAFENPQLRKKLSDIRKDLIWITDGVKDMRISRSADIPNGFHLGRTNGPNLKKRVAQFDLNGNKLAEYDSMAEACKATGASGGNLSLCCRGHIKTCVGYKWAFV